MSDFIPVCSDCGAGLYQQHYQTCQRLDGAAVGLREAASDWARGLSAPVVDARDSTFLRLTRRLERAAVRYGMTKKRGYSDEFPTTREKRVYFMLDKIPPALWIRVKAKAKREGVSLRSLILGWCKEWVESGSLKPEE